jgi:hypothetical protein
MYRRSLILRRFGPLEFGLGYFENGAWIDHTTLADGGVGLGIGDGTFAAVHDLLGCCGTEARSRPITVEPGSLAPTFIDRRDHVQSVARRSSAG